MDEVSPHKQAAGIFAKVHSGRVRYSDRYGWLVRDADVWRCDELQVIQAARQFCHEAARHRRGPKLDAEAVLRLAAFEPRFTAALPEGHMLFAFSAVGRASL